jgi:hypothetical protein
LILIAVVITYSAAISLLIPPKSADVILSFYGTGIIAFFFAMAMATGGVMVLKSDRDYLFTLPLSTRDLSLSIYFSQFIAFGVTVLFMFTYFAQALASAILVIDLAALALVFTSLGVLAPSLSKWARALLAVALPLWTLLGITGFPLSPGSAFNGNVVGGTATLIALAVVTTAAAFRNLSHVELDLMRNLVRTTSADIKSPNSFVGKSPVSAIYSMNLSALSLAGRMNMAGTSRYVSARVRTRWVVAATSAAAAAYAAFVVLLGQPFTAGSDSLPVAILTAVALSFLAFFFSQSAISNERIWLSLTSLPAATYFRNLVASKVLSLLLVLAPFALADAVLFALGYGEALGAFGVVVLVIPAVYVLEILWSAYLAPIQVKGEDMTMPAQFSITQMLTALPLILVILMASFATIVPLVAFAGGAVLCLVAGLLTVSERFWERVVVKLTENGFV